MKYKCFCSNSVRQVQRDDFKTTSNCREKTFEMGIAKRGLELILVILAAAVCGGCVGWLQATIALRSAGFASDGIGVGVWVSVPLVLILYYLVLKRQVQVNEALILLSLCIAGGVVAALAIGPLSAIITPTILIIGALYVRFEREEASS